MTDPTDSSDLSQSLLHNAWNYSLVNISGNDIKISNILIAIIVFTICIKFSNKLTAIIIKLLSTKLHNDQDSINTTRRLLSYFFWVITAFISLQVANISLAIFTFIGGAFAIGIGFGAQGLISNFINTIIIMLEKPIKIGDIIETQGVIGEVKSIGNRHITIASFDSEEILIPNSSLIQNKLSKWSYDEDILTYHVYVNILKEVPLEVDHKLITKQLKLAAKEFNFLSSNTQTEVYLTKITKSEDQFCLVLFCDRNILKSPESTKNEINMSLLKQIKNTFTVEYSKNLGA